VFAAYYWAGAVYACQAVFFAWANQAMRFRQPAFRAVVLAAMNMGSNAVNAWWSIVFYGASMAPWFRVINPLFFFFFFFFFLLLLSISL
jgi:MFS transporter, ACS family, pantothenate transporter